jgi:hypothetical protein
VKKRTPLLAVITLVLVFASNNVCRAAIVTTNAGLGSGETLPVIGDGDPWYNFTVNSLQGAATPISITGLLQTGVNLNEPYETTIAGSSGAGTANGSPVVLAWHAPTATPYGSYWLTESGYFYVDNEMFPLQVNALLDIAGLYFVDTKSGHEVNIYWDGSNYIYYDNSGFNEPVTFTIQETNPPTPGGPTQIPEPATIIIWSLLGAGSWLGMRVWRRKGGPVGREPWSPENRQAIYEIVGRRND